MLPVPHTTLINASAKSPTSVNALAGNGVGHPVPERMVWKSNPLIVGSYKMLSREEMSIQTRLTGHVPFSESKMCPPTHPVHELAVPIPLEYTFSRGADDPSVPSQKPERVQPQALAPAPLPTKLATTAAIPVLRSKALRFARTGFGVRFGSDDSGTPVQEFLILEMVSMPCRFCGINKSWFSDVVI